MTDTSAFGALHATGSPLLLANIWDVTGARIVEAAGATAIATTSAGVAWAHGAADGDRLGREDALALIRRVVAAVRVPVTADIETGYGETEAALTETIRGVLDAGAVGINLEDARYDGVEPLRSVPAQCARLAAVRATADAAGVPLFVNARTDVYLRAVGEPGQRLETTVERAKAYLDAGADGLFVPGLLDPAEVSQLVAAIDAPVNLMAGPGAPSVAELTALGVRRISLGASIAAAAYAVADRAAREFFGSGGYTALENPLDFALLNASPAEPPART